MEHKEQTEPNWTELLEKEWAQDRVCGSLVKGMREDGHSDKEIYQLVESFG